MSTEITQDAAPAESVETDSAPVEAPATAPEASPEPVEATEPAVSEPEVPVESAEEKVDAVVEKSLADLLADSELKENKSLQKFKDVDSLAKSYVELNGYLGKKFEDLSPQELEGYYAKLGRPESKDGYNMELPEGSNEEFVNWYKDNAFDLGLTNEQAGKLAKSFAELEQSKMTEAAEQKQKMQAEWQDSIKREFGVQFDKKLGSAKKALKEFAGEEFVEYINQTGLGDHPALIKAFANIGDHLLEDTLVEGGHTKAAFGMSAEEAATQISKLYNDPVFMKQLRDPGNPHHELAKDKFQKLYKIKTKHKV